ncbi:sensor histidine kinase [Paraburkholderia rhynchosiae]|uniref:histidine kinase n=1 Tax=Paraburkholderia rhynchosiae TaxID=487049 RepID=A0A2N7WAL6_9BURK|nr:HAMP domain-containing sensor histidine kinase [Paraburkholderia rhynchosiae]PMS26442.1 histidine kinase [Paraburkholderia rhynchosiae]CAB3716092.1 Globin-coupled histidine kinase [Paraburkholderia rhynchosiae]
MTTSSTGTAGAQPVTSGFAVSERTAHLRAETALFMRDHVLSLVSHDLRGPLNAIHSWAYVLERKLDPNDPNSQRAVTGIRNGVDQQVKLLETIVDTTRAETRALALAYEPFPLHPLLDESAEEVRMGLARTRGVEIVMNSQLATEQLNGDRERLAAALWVMLTFAVEASAQGATTTLASRADATHWHAAVTYETSTALDDPALPHVLETFARKQAREPREANRIAWVLALCKRVAEAHGGSFEQQDASGSAQATLALRIPLSAQAAR